MPLVHLQLKNVVSLNQTLGLRPAYLLRYPVAIPKSEQVSTKAEWGLSEGARSKEEVSATPEMVPARLLILAATTKQGRAYLQELQLAMGLTKLVRDEREP